MAMQALSNSKFEEARQSFGRAVKLDPNFGLAYAGMAIASANMGQQQEAATYVQEAIRHVDKMTERERFRTRGLFYYVTNDYEACVKEYGDLLARYEADAAARNNLALCSTKLREHDPGPRGDAARGARSCPSGRSTGSTPRCIRPTPATSLPPSRKRWWPRSCRTRGRCRRWRWPSRARARLPRRSRATRRWPTCPAPAVLHDVGAGRRRAVRGPVRRCRVALHRRRQGRPRGQGRRSRGGEVGGAGLHRAGPRPTRPGPCGRRPGAGQQHRHADPLPGGADLRAGGRNGPGPGHRRAARRRTAGRAAGLRQDHRRRDRARAEGRRGRRSSCCPKPTSCSTPGSAASTWAAPIWRPAPSRRPIRSSIAA